MTIKLMNILKAVRDGMDFNNALNIYSDSYKEYMDNYYKALIHTF